MDRLSGKRLLITAAGQEIGRPRADHLMRLRLLRFRRIFVDIKFQREREKNEAITFWFFWR